ncbi:MAG: alpha/beta hydrolase [Thermomonas sp.]|nr:alpha/beta hydrolase [Thermomonas sp.]
MQAGTPIDGAPADATTPPAMADDLRGVARLLVRGVTATTDLAEGVHAGILGRPGPAGGSGASTRGIPRIAYQGVRMTANLVGGALDASLARLTPWLGPSAGSSRRDALVAVLNGVLGDHLAASANPLALEARLRVGGRALPLRGEDWPSLPLAPTPRLLVQVHGLCMNHLQWRRQGHDHGERLAAELGYTPVHLHYNSGLSIESNGRTFATLLQQLIQDWPVPVERFAILGHSMGGLVARAAIASALQERQQWLERLDQLVFLGTPHHGAPLERAGHVLQSVLGLTPWTAPFMRLGEVRSAGIQDLRHGLGEDLPLPPGVRAYAVAASLQGVRAGHDHRRLRGDGLVPVRSAFGDHRDPLRALGIPEAHRLLVERTGHLDLLNSNAVYATLRHWLA